MSPELEKKLLEKYPRLYAGALQGPNKNLMCFGFACGDGWFNILDVLSAKLEQGEAIALQVKEKFGTLRFYAGPCTDEEFALIDFAEWLSERTCEHCGSPGKLRTEGWRTVKCDGCVNPPQPKPVDTAPATG